MSGLSPQASRSLFIAELLLFGGPSFVFVLLSAIISGSWSLSSALSGAVEGIVMVLVWAVMMASGYATLKSSMIVIQGVIHGGVDSLQQNRRHYRRALLLGAPTLLLWNLPTVLVLMHYRSDDVKPYALTDVITIFYSWGFAMLVPVLHMGLELWSRQPAIRNAQ